MDKHTEAITQACRTLAAAGDAPRLETLARAAGLSPFHFHRVFKAVVGLTPRQYRAARRAERVRAELTRRKTVTDAIYGAGFNSNGRFYEKSREMLGMTPGAFRSRGAGETIRYATAKCALGCVLVAATAKGVCAVSLGDAPKTLVEELRSRYSNATAVTEDRALRRWTAEIVAFIERPRETPDLPLDIRGTAFQHRVWQALRAIPTGSTATYAEIAERIGAAKSVRAVARACASNALALVVPCHRVVRSDGGLAGYRWGVERKKRLLDREKTTRGEARGARRSAASRRRSA